MTGSPRSSSPLVLDGVRFDRGRFRLGPVHLEVQPGAVTCLLGSNGSGKTTLLELALGLLVPDAGSISIVGGPACERGRTFMGAVGYVADDPTAVIDELTAAEYWSLCAALSARTGIAPTAEETRARAAALADQLGLLADGQPIATFSHGMRTKLQLVAALAHRPRLLMLDEVHNGLDPLAMEIADRLVGDACRAGTGVLAATHDLRWAEEIADAVVVLDRGSVVLHGERGEAWPDGAGGLRRAFVAAVAAR
jgi:ABC-2 type transport system ATP-binding protein